MPEFIDYKELAKRLTVSRQTLTKWRKIGLPSIKIGGRVMFDYKDVVQWVKEHKQ